MVDNKGNMYRTRGALSLGFAVIGIAVALIVFFATDLGIAPSIGVFLLFVGGGLLAMCAGYTGTPDKFGPSERDYRLVWGLLVIIIGVLLILTTFGLDWYWYVAVIIIAVALIGMAMALINSKKISNE